MTVMKPNKIPATTDKEFHEEFKEIKSFKLLFKDGDPKGDEYFEQHYNDGTVISDGWGNVYAIPQEGYSHEYKRGGFLFRYDYRIKLLQVLDPQTKEVIDAQGLNCSNWLENPSYWIDNYYDDVKASI